jgi:hypothetical protein
VQERAEFFGKYKFAAVRRDCGSAVGIFEKLSYEFEPNIMAKHFSSEWLFEDLQEEASFIRKPMFGGLAFYLHGLLMAVLMEDVEDTKWQGVLIATSHEHHDSIKKAFPEVAPHPILKKWLYLPTSCEDFEAAAQRLVRLILRADPRFGVVPSSKKRTKHKKVKPKKVKRARS